MAVWHFLQSLHFGMAGHEKPSAPVSSAFLLAALYKTERNGELIMNQEMRKIEVFSAGCAACDETIQLVRSLACSACEIEVHDMHRPEVAAKAKAYGINSVPAVVINGKLAGCCSDRGIDAATLRREGVGVPN